MNFLLLALSVLLIITPSISAKLGLSQPQQDTINPLQIDSYFSISNNSGNSVYPSIAASDNNVFVVWEDDYFGQSISYDKRNYDILFVRSIDGGNSFENVTNLSNSTSLSGRPIITAFDGNVYVVWTEDVFNERQIWFTRSTDSGKTFDAPVNLDIIHNVTGSTIPKAIAAHGNDVYVVWRELGDNEKTGNILLKTSADRGSTFGETRIIGNSAVYSSSPKVAAYDKNVYVVWDVIPDKVKGQDNREGIFITKSSDHGTTFEDVSTLSVDKDIGEAQVAAYLNDVYIAWAGSVYKPQQSTSDIFFTYSLDNGSTFGDINLINRGFTGSENVELASNGTMMSAVWQDKISGNGEIFHKTTLANRTSFADATRNLSSNEGLSECPSVAISGNATYVVWEDNTYGNHEILFNRIL